MTTKEDVETPIQFQEHSAYTDVGLNTGPQPQPTLGPAWGWLSLPRISPGQGTRSILGHFTLKIT